jgi:hypothetical protein
VKPLKAAKLNKWKSRADYKATLRVVHEDGKEFDEAEI